VRRALGFPAAALALLYPLFLPYAVAYSRTFLPDVLMVALLMVGFWSAHRWIEQPCWRRALLAGVVLGLAILIKVFAVFFVGFGLAGMLLAERGLRRSLAERQVWLVAGLALLIPALYYLVPRADFTPGGYFQTFVLPFTSRLLDWEFYLQWRNRLTLFNLGLVVVSLLFTFLLPKALRGLTLGLWGGYLVYGMVLAGPIYHKYYSLSVVFIVALGLAGLAGHLYDVLRQQKLVWRLALAAALLFVIADSSFQARKQLRSPDLSGEPAFWAELSADLPDGRYIGVAEDYNTRMQYYGWRFIAFYSYPGEADLSTPEADPERFNSQDVAYFLTRVEGSDYFIATTPIDRVTKNILYYHYPLVRSGERYWVFDLDNPTQPPE
jgi:MFS family permease